MHPVERFQNGKAYFKNKFGAEMRVRRIQFAIERGFSICYVNCMLRVQFYCKEPANG